MGCRRRQLGVVLGAPGRYASIAAIRKAIDLGINWIDTAAIYGLGHSEEIVGQAVKESHVKPFLFTKSGMVWDDGAGSGAPCWRSAARWRTACAASRWSAIDLYQIHWPVGGS